MSFDPANGLVFFGDYSGPRVSTHRTLAMNTWQHLAVTYNGTNFVFYINGNAVTSVAGSLGPANAEALKIGDSGTCSGFVGLIDEVALYNRALTTNEIQAIYNAGSTGKCQDAPTIVVQPAGQIVSVTSSATFTVTAAGTPLLRYQWRFNGTNIAGATGPSLALVNVQAADAGAYSVRATNAFGSVVSSDAVLGVNPFPVVRLRLKVGLNPDGTTQVQFVGNNGKSYRIEMSTDMMNWVSLGICTADGDGNVEFTDRNTVSQPIRLYRAVEQ